MFGGARLIYAARAEGDAVFSRTFCAKAGSSAVITVGALGVFEVYLNGERVGNDVLAPGWQEYRKRIGAFRYELNNLKSKNTIEIFVSRGWYSGRIQIGYKPEATPSAPAAVIAKIDYTDERGCSAVITTDESFSASRTKTVEADIYDGIVYDARRRRRPYPASILEHPTDTFFLLESVRVKEFESVAPVRLIITPKGERVLDFGVNMVGYPILRLKASAGERISFSFAEILDSEGNFYNENYRLAKCRYEYICRDGYQEFRPFGTFYGYRYLRLDEYPHEYREGEVTSVWIHSEMERTGSISSANPLLDKLYENIIRGQRGNFVDIPTDCPQRDERLGWTGDAEIFVRAAAYNYDCLEFFKKWLCDVVLSQTDRGVVPMVVPLPERYKNWALDPPRAAWSDLITVIPWELYMAYGDKSVLSLTVDAMRGHIDAITSYTKTENLWTGGPQFGDWLGLDAKEGSLEGSSDPELIASAFYARSTELYIRTCGVLGIECSKYESLYNNIKKEFIKTYEPKLKTQTECAVALKFGLAGDREAVLSHLVKLIREAGVSLKTGFVGTPYILHALIEGGEAELAYDLLLREEYPSWLYPVTMGATTIWEHWDGLRPDGKLWSPTMNSYNHYAYGAVADWIFGCAAGIMPREPGYKSVLIAPTPSRKLGKLCAEYNSRAGKIRSSWEYVGNRVKFSMLTPTDATVIIAGKKHECTAGEYSFEVEAND